MMSSSSSDGDGTIIDPKESRIKNRGKSDIETLARTIDDRLQNRLRVSLWERKKFLDICFEIAKKEEESRNGSLSRFSKEGLVILVEELKGRVAQKPRASRLYDELLKLIGYYDPDKRYACMHACIVVVCELSINCFGGNNRCMHASS